MRQNHVELVSETVSDQMSELGGGWMKYFDGDIQQHQVIMDSAAQQRLTGVNTEYARIWPAGQYFGDYDNWQEIVVASHSKIN